MNKDDIVFSGVGIVCPLGNNYKDVKQALLSSQVGLTFDEDNNLIAPVRGFDYAVRLEQMESLPATQKRCAYKYGLRASLAKQTAISAAIEAWESAGLNTIVLDDSKTGCIAVSEMSTQQALSKMITDYQIDHNRQNPKSVLSAISTDLLGIISEIFSIKGEGFSLSATSASGNVALIKAMQMIRLGIVDRCLVVAELTELADFYNELLTEIGAKLAIDTVGYQITEGLAQPFDSRFSGFAYGQGSGCIILESADACLKRGKKPLALMESGIFALDANRMTNPTESGEVYVMKQALQQAKLSAADINAINAHATGTNLGDNIELIAIRRVFGSETDKIWINSTKGLMGHCLYSSGVIEAIVCIAQMQSNTIHANPFLRQPLLEQYKFVGQDSEEAKLNYIMSNSFGFSGINSSIILSRNYE